MNFLTLLCNNAVKAANPAPVVTQMKNEYDVAIAAIVCGAIVLVAIIALIMFVCCRKKKKGTTNTSDQAPKNNDEDRIYNEKMTYVAKLLDLLKEQTKADAKLKKDECKHYEDTLLGLIKECETKKGH
jgi:uncharacterized protein HemX